MVIYLNTQQIKTMQPVLIGFNPLRSPRARWEALVITDALTIDDVTIWIQARLIFHQWRDDSEKRALIRTRIAKLFTKYPCPIKIEFDGKHLHMIDENRTRMNWKIGIF